MLTSNTHEISRHVTAPDYCCIYQLIYPQVRKHGSVAPSQPHLPPTRLIVQDTANHMEPRVAVFWAWVLYSMFCPKAEDHRKEEAVEGLLSSTASILSRTSGVSWRTTLRAPRLSCT